MELLAAEQTPSEECLKTLFLERTRVAVAIAVLLDILLLTLGLLRETLHPTHGVLLFEIVVLGFVGSVTRYIGPRTRLRRLYVSYAIVAIVVCLTTGLERGLVADSATMPTRMASFAIGTAVLLPWPPQFQLVALLGSILGCLLNATVIYLIADTQPLLATWSPPTLVLLLSVYVVSLVVTRELEKLNRIRCNCENTVLL